MSLTQCLVLGCAALALSTGASLPAAYASDLYVSVVLEDSVFLEGQTAYAIVCVRNATRRTVMEPDLRIEQFRAKLVRTDTGEKLRSNYSGSPLFWGVEGLTLKKGEIRCSHISNLASKFGVESRDSMNLSDRVGDRASLEPGSYALTWEYRFRPRRDEKLLRGEVRFVVRPLASDAGELALVRSFLSELPPFERLHREPLHRYAREKLPQFYGSKFLLRVYQTTGLLLGELDFEEIFEGMKAAGAPAERRAALLALRLSMTDTRGQFTPQWKQEMLGKVESQIERDVLSIVPRRPSTPSR